MPVGGDWTPLKREATDFAQSAGSGSVAPQSLLRHYIKARTRAGSLGGGGGGSGGGSAGERSGGGGGGSGGGGHGRGRAGGAWSAGLATAQNVGGFISRVSDVGLAEALREVGLSDLVGKPSAEVSGALLDKLASPANTLDEAAARQALVKLNDELLAEAQTFEEMEQALTKTGLVDVLVRFFGHYLYECFCRDFYERLLKKVGSAKANQSLKSIKDCIDAALKAKLANRDAAKFDWRGAEGRNISDQILKDVLDIFEVPA